MEEASIIKKLITPCYVSKIQQKGKTAGHPLSHNHGAASILIRDNIIRHLVTIVLSIIGDCDHMRPRIMHSCSAQHPNQTREQELLCDPLLKKPQSTIFLQSRRNGLDSLLCSFGFCVQILKMTQPPCSLISQKQVPGRLKNVCG